jgi:hypothetical protein
MSPPPSRQARLAHALLEHETLDEADAYAVAVYRRPASASRRRRPVSAS